MRIGVIFVGATTKQNEYWWPSYHRCIEKYHHDIILVHRDMDGVPSVIGNENTIPDNIIYENKILPTGEIPHKAFGAYRHYFLKHFSKYDAFAFISDDVYLRRDNWLTDVVEMFDKYPKLGMISPMLHNHPPHARAPIWFGRTECLKRVNWNFNSDHEGEMTMADRVVNTGYFVAQIGHKVDFAYDPFWDGNANPRVVGSPQPNQWIEKIWYGDKHFDEKYTDIEIGNLGKYIVKLMNEDGTDEEITDSRISPNLNNQRWNVCLEIQPYHGLIYNKSLHIVIKEGYKFITYDKDAFVGPLDPENRVFFGPNNGIYNSNGINKDNPIAILI